MSVKLTEEMLSALPDARGHFGAFGGRFVSETLFDSLLTLERQYKELKQDPEFQARFDQELACDVTVLKDKDVSSRKAYLTAMLELAMAKPTHSVAATLFSDKNTIKERIMNE